MHRKFSKMGKFDGSSNETNHGGNNSLIKFIQDQLDLINIKLNSLSITPILERIKNFLLEHLEK